MGNICALNYLAVRSDPQRNKSRRQHLQGSRGVASRKVVRAQEVSAAAGDAADGRHRRAPRLSSDAPTQSQTRGESERQCGQHEHDHP